MIASESLEILVFLFLLAAQRLLGRGDCRP